MSSQSTREHIHPSLHRPRSAGERPVPETLPSWVYTDPEFLTLEKEHVFRRQWLLVGHLGEIPRGGDYMTLDAVDERIFVIRGEDGRVRALHNVCRHRASRVVTGERGNCAHAITCPYHGWTYGLDGRLRGVPAERSFRDLDKSKYPLPEVEMDVWHGFVFVRISPGPGPAVRELLAPFDGELEPYRLAAMTPHRRTWTEPMDVNWKCVHDNDNEGYHVPVGHPGLRRLFGDSYGDESFPGGVSRSQAVLQERVSPVWSEGLYQRLAPGACTHLPEPGRRKWLYFGLFPNTSLGIYPDMVEFFQCFPIAPGRSILRGAAYAHPDPSRTMRVVRYLNGRINRTVWREDLDFCHWAHAGMKSSSYQGGPLSDKEVGVRQFHDRIRALLPVARRPQPPAAGSVAEENRRLSALA